MNQEWDKIWINGQVATCDDGYGLIENAAVACQAEKIVWVGRMCDLPAAPDLLAKEVHELQGRCMTPGLIDCHTHVVFGGNRANEFEKRLQGVSYQEIAKQGGGIQSTVTATRKASEQELYDQSVRRAHALHMSGVTTMEIKSGYGLDLATELKMLRVAKDLATHLPLTVCTTFLGAHTVPAEYKEKADDYIAYVCDEMLPAVAEEKLASAVDVFCESIAFNLKQTENVFKAAKKHDLQIKCHAEQLTDSGCAVLAAKYQAKSVDHLEYVSVEGIKALARSGTVAVMLPGAYYYLREKQHPPIELLREHGVPMAVATDCNPGTSPMLSLTLAMNMACTLFRMTPEEALSGVTKHAAQALGMLEVCGTITVGKKADLVIWDVQHPAELSYYIGGNLVRQIIKDGMIY